ncbi:acyltransferase [Acidovorax sp. Be4]|uniref:Acyltransferase n=1 Tax=Acidovorax bellezanensis TaxID=2976702 RepID=A0ABT2PGX3_9BURK|nr:acyltransferase family protein [Acidovorax sp. Be4]MCT9809667.1 acyltransferase [Acidovorax sp. Be4]
MNYRKDVQMLRGIAVLLVVLFHINVFGFSNGFLGVDVFFVISGYLMALMYDPERKAEFFTKRAKRLLPAYFVTIMATLLLGVLVTIPSDFDQIAKQGWFAIAFSSNIGFWLENSYFDKAAFKPLLHLWSLGVEIQFYLLVPVIFWFLKKTKLAGYLFLTITSVALCFFVVGISPKTGFFLLPFRLWQFLFGFGVAAYFSRERIAASDKSAWVGGLFLCVILYIPFFNVDGQAIGFWNGHPGLVSLVISTATALTLLFGIPKVLQSNLLATLLERLGNYSYSVYLAHFPVIVLFLYEPFSGTNLKPSSLSQTIIIAFFVVAASALLYTCVEARFRHGQAQAKWTIGAVLTIVTLGAVGGALQTLSLSPQERNIYAAWTDRAPYRCGKLNRILEPKSVSCEITAAVENPSTRILLVGNSHADSIKSTFAEAASSKNATVFFMVENGPLMQGGIDPQGLIKEAIARKVSTIVLHYSHGSVVESALISQIEKVVKLADDNSLRVSFVMPVPVWDRSVPQMLWQEMKQGKLLSSQSAIEYEGSNKILVDALSRMNQKNFSIYKTQGVLCKESCLLTASGGKPLYFDENHLTLTGANMLRPVFDDLIQRVIF